MEMNVFDVITTMATIILGGGWFIYYRANKRKANGEATQSEAEGWRSMQEVYQKTIEDMKIINEDARQDRDHFKESRNALRAENEEMRKKYKEVEEQIMQQKKDIARLGRRIDGIAPFLCGVVGCQRRKKVDISDNDIDEQIEQIDE